MEFEKLFSLIFICLLLLKATLSAYVSDLKTNVDCKTLLAKKVAERSKDPTLVSEFYNFFCYDLMEVIFDNKKKTK